MASLRPAQRKHKSVPPETVLQPLALVPVTDPAGSLLLLFPCRAVLHSSKFTFFLNRPLCSLRRAASALLLQHGMFTSRAAAAEVPRFYP